MKKILAIVFLTMVSPAVLAAEDQTPGGGHISVTPLEACLKQLSPEDRADIRANYDRPWQECQKRVANKKAEAQTVKAGEAGDAQPQFQQPVSGYARVAAEKKKEEKAADSEKEETAPPKKGIIKRLFRIE